MRKHNFRNLEIWKEGIEITDLIYKYTSELPNDERFNLISQMTRAAVSIPSNIAEGSGRGTSADFKRFLEYAMTSCYELETQLIICGRRNYGNLDLKNQIIERLTIEEKRIFKFIQKLGY